MQADNRLDSVSISIGDKLRLLSRSPSEQCMFKVHKQLHRVNEKAYEPEIVTIGPYHHGKESLQMMEEHKLRYLKLLLDRRNENANNYVIAVRSLEEKARRCYAEPISLTSDKMIEIMVLDGCFIIELMRKFEMPCLRDENDTIFEMEWMFNSLQRDLILFENQLPFFILCKLFDMIEAPDNHKRLIRLALCFFHDLYPGKEKRLDVDGTSRYEIKHLLGLIHNNWLCSFAGNEHTKTTSWGFIPSATQLREAGVKLERVKGGTLFDVKFKNGIMQIPTLTIEDRTETYFRNLIAYEQYCPENQLCYITDYVRFVDCLIDSPKDVEILSRRGIVKNWLGDDEVISMIFNKISDAVVGTSRHFVYADIFKKVNTHCSKRRNRWIAKLNRNYLNSPWAVISVLAALVLLLLTFTQTFFTVFPRFSLE